MPDARRSRAACRVGGRRRLVVRRRPKTMSFIGIQTGDRFVKDADELRTSAVFGDVRPAAYDPAAYLAENETDGVWGSVIYPSQGLVLFSVPVTDVVTAVDARVQRLDRRRSAATTPTRLKGIAMVNLDDPDDGGRRAHALPRARPVRRARSPSLRRRGFRSATPTTTGSGPTAQDLDMPLSMHTATDRGDPRVGDAAFRLDVKHVPPSVFCQQGPPGAPVARRPRLHRRVRAVSRAAGRRGRARARVDPVLPRPDGLHVHRSPAAWRLAPLPGRACSRATTSAANCFASFQEDAVGIRVRDVIGVDTLMWGSDYPHTESTFPRSQEILCDILADVAPADARKIVVGQRGEPVPLRSAARGGRTPDDRPRDPGRHRRRRQRRARRSAPTSASPTAASSRSRDRVTARRGDRRERAPRHARVRRHPHALRPAGAVGPRAVAVARTTASPSVVAGNCGYSLAPTRPADRASLCRTLDKVEDMRLATLEAGIDWDFETYPEYLAAVHRRGTAINFGGYVGHTPVRMYVMGDDAYEREATDDEIDADASRSWPSRSRAARSASRATAAASTSATAAGPVPSIVATQDEDRGADARHRRDRPRHRARRAGRELRVGLRLPARARAHDHVVVDPHLPARVEVARAVPRQARAALRGPRRGCRRVGAGHVPADPAGARDDRAHRVLLGARVRAVRRRAARDPPHVLRRSCVAQRVSPRSSTAASGSTRGGRRSASPTPRRTPSSSGARSPTSRASAAATRSTSSPTSSLADDLDVAVQRDLRQRRGRRRVAAHAHRRLHHGAVRRRRPRRARSATRSCPPTSCRSGYATGS